MSIVQVYETYFHEGAALPEHGVRLGAVVLIDLGRLETTLPPLPPPARL